MANEHLTTGFLHRGWLGMGLGGATTAAHAGFSLEGVVSGIAVGVGVFCVTTLLKRIFPGVFK